ncbi:hypothetical protein Z043_103567 [Scleropages formosus]|uniref:Uncharacterized protein n=1 Tax=Scleropages formosus TaxID=113540 RepID=A0A0P7V410_SCLFO|nr:hypothetical protein Z043_103567 [Scleropages formosus]
MSRLTTFAEGLCVELVQRLWDSACWSSALGLAGKPSAFCYILITTQQITRPLLRGSNDTVSWKFDLRATSRIDTSLEKDDVTPTELMDEEDVLQECKALDRKLVDFLVQPQ